MKSLRSALLFASITTLATIASASDNRWSIRIGSHYPTFDTIYTSQLGGALGLSYAVFRDEGTSIELEGYTTGFGYDDFTGSNFVTVPQWNVLMLFGSKGDGFYFGGGIGSARASSWSSSGSATGDQATVYHIIGGLRYQGGFFEARLTSGDVPAFRGLDLLYGVRF